MASKFILGLALLSGLAFASCDKKEKTPESNQEETNLPKLGLSGTFVWNFNIPGLGDQVSKMTFFEDSVVYDMAGPAYTTNYLMMKESYAETNNQKRWIGVGKGGSINKDGVYFVMFVKDITATSATIYKRECENKAEAESFAYPAADATADHGWNIYNKQ